MSGSPGISDPGHGHANTPRGWREDTGGSGTGPRAISGTGNAAYDGNIVANSTTGITASIGTLSATRGTLAATVGTLSGGPGGTRPSDTPAYLVVSYIIKT